MSIQISSLGDGVEELYTPPTLKEMCLYKCLMNKNILTKEEEVDESTSGNGEVDWAKYRLKEPIQRDLVEALLDASEKYLFMLTPKSEPVLAAIRMSQPEHLVKVDVSNTYILQDRQLKFLISGGNVKSLDIHGCATLGMGSLDAINKFGSKLEYLRIGDSSIVLPRPDKFSQSLPILRTPNLKTFIVSDIRCEATKMTSFWRFLLQDFISNLENLQITGCSSFQTLQFLEPAKSKLLTLSLKDSVVVVTENANVLETILKLDTLRTLNVVGSSIGKALVGENVVQRLLTTMPNLTRLAVDPSLAKDINVDTSIRSHGSVTKRLEFFGFLENDDATELRKLKLLANHVAYFGTVEGELRVLEYYSKRGNFTSSYDPTLERLLESSSLMAQTPPYKTVTVISLLIKTIKNNGIEAVPFEFFEVLSQLLTTDVAPKLGEVITDQCVGVISDWTVAMIEYYEDDEDAEAKPQFISSVIDVVMNLDGELCLDHYMDVLPKVMRMAELTMTRSAFDNYPMEDCKDLLKKIAQLLEKAVNLFTGETNALWGISSVLVIIKELKKEVLVSEEGDRIDLVEIFKSLVASLRKLCFNSGPRRVAFHSAGGVRIIVDLVPEIIDGCLGLADGVALLEFMKIILQDSKLNWDRSEYELLASTVEKLSRSLPEGENRKGPTLNQ